MLLSSESDPFTTTPTPPSPLPRSGDSAIILGFPKERHSFRNVDRVRQRFKASKKSSDQQDRVVSENSKKRKFNGKSTTNASRSGSGSATEPARVSASTVPSRIRMWEEEKEKKKDANTETSQTLSRYTLETAKQMESASVGKTIPSSPTGRDVSKPTTERGDKLRRRRTFAGYTHAQPKNLPHIDLISKLPRSSSASPALVRTRALAITSQKKEKSVSNISKTLVLHRLSRKRHRKDSLGQSHSRHRSSTSTNTLSHSISRTLPNKTLGEPMTTAAMNDNTSTKKGAGISITQLSARSLELLIENGLALVFKKLEVNHGFSNDTVKRAWLRCNGDIEATDHLLLTMRKAAEEAEASYLGDESFVVEGSESEEEEEEEEEEERRATKRPRWSEPHISPLQSESIDSRYAPHLSSDRDFSIYPMVVEEYTPPVGTKAEMYRRLTEQGRHEEARKILMYNMTSSSRKNSTPLRKKDVITNDKSEKTTLSLSRPVSANRIGDTTVSNRTTETTPGIPGKSIHHHDSSLSRTHTIQLSIGKTSGKVEEPTTIPSPTETTPTTGRLISSSSRTNTTESRNPSIIHEPRTKHTTPIHQHDDDDQNLLSSREPHNTQIENPPSSPKSNNNTITVTDDANPGTGDSNWTLSDEEMLANPIIGKSQLDRLSVKYGEQNVLRRFLKVVQERG